MVGGGQLTDEGFFSAADSADVLDGQMTVVIMNEMSIILTRVGGAIHAFSARCPHASGDLTKGELYRGRIGCPEHDYFFDIHTGFPVWPEDEVCRLKKYQTKEVNGRLLIKL